MKIFYIRHASTKANLDGEIVKDYDKYDIVDFDKEEWFKKVGKHLPKNFKLFTSPVKRCMQTAEILFPGKHYETIEELKEFDVSPLTEAGLKFWEIDEQTFEEKVFLSKTDVYHRWVNALIEIESYNHNTEDVVIIGHGFYGRLIRSLYEKDEDTPFEILNSKNFQLRNLDMMEIQFSQVQNVWRNE